MPKLSNDRVPCYSRHVASGQAVVHLNGRDIYLGKYDTAASRHAYNRVIGEWVANGRQLPVRVAEITVLEIIDRFWEYARTYYGAESGELANYRLALRQLKRVYGETPAVEFGPLSLKSVRAEMLKPQKEKDRKRGKEIERPAWCRTHVNRQIGRIRRVFKWAVSEELVPESVYSALCTVDGLRRGRSDAPETAPVRPVPEWRVLATLPFLSRQLQAVVKLQLLTGARGGELLAMRPCDIDTRSTVWVYLPESHKTAHHEIAREIRLGPKAQEIVKPFLTRPDAAYLFSPAEAKAEWLAARSAARKTPKSCGNAPGSNRKVHPSRQPGDCYDSRAYAHAVKHGAKRAGVPHWHPHQLRHTAGTKMRREFGLDVARVILGHTTPDTTALYAEADMKMAEKVMAEVG